METAKQGTFIQNITKETFGYDINKNMNYTESSKLHAFYKFLHEFKRKQLFSILDKSQENKKIFFQQISESNHHLIKTPDYLHEFVRRSLSKKSKISEKTVKTISIVIKQKTGEALRFLEAGLSGFQTSVFDAHLLPARGKELNLNESISLLQAETEAKDSAKSRLKYQFIKDGENSVLLTILMDKALLGKKIIGLFKKDRLIKSFETNMNTAYFPQITQGFYLIKINNPTGQLIDTANIEILNN